MTRRKCASAWCQNAGTVGIVTQYRADQASAWENHPAAFAVHCTDCAARAVSQVPRKIRRSGGQWRVTLTDVTK